MKLQPKCMGKEKIFLVVLLLINVFLVGCNGLDSQSTSFSIIYGVTTIVALLLLVSYTTLLHKKELWFLLLFSSVFIVNTGYFALSISKNLEEALLANRIAYLGSVFLPMSMFMIIMNVCELQYKKILPGFLLFLSIIVFLVAASPGYLDIYYKEVSFILKDGVGMLDKTYGKWHCLYLFYLVAYFGIMVSAILYAAVVRKVKSKLYAIMLAGAVLVNIGVWMLEQLVDIDFEFLAVSYIISEFFMLSLCLIRQEHTMQEEKKLSDAVAESNHFEDFLEKPCEELPSQPDAHAKENVLAKERVESENAVKDEQLQLFLEGVGKLTPTEKRIYHYYLDGRSTKEILQAMNITENTLKYHNKNIYGKLGVSSRKQLKEIAKKL